MAIERLQRIPLENVKVLFPNFSGLANQYNAEGNRVFNVQVSEEQKNLLEEQGFNVREKEAYDPEDEPTYTLKVKVSYMFRQPRIVLITSRGRTDLPEETIQILDWIDIEKADIWITPSVWNKKDNPRYDPHVVASIDRSTAYLRSAYITQEEDEFDKKYADVPEAQESARASMFNPVEAEFDEENAPF